MIEAHDDGVDWQIAAADIEALELQSICAAVENMLLKAEELNIGSLWCGDILYAYQTISKCSEKPVVLEICLGYADEKPLKRKRKKLIETCKFIK